MYSHVGRSEARTWLGGRRYRLTAQIHLTADELRLINHGRLTRMEIFYDPRRDEFDAAAEAAHAKARERGLFLISTRDLGVIAVSEFRALSGTLRALSAFRVNVGDLINGVTIEHKSLQAIIELERAIVECIDRVDRFVRAAGGYVDLSEDIYAPGTDEDPTVPPAEWTRRWRR